jgi:GTP-binding protein Era
MVLPPPPREEDTGLVQQPRDARVVRVALVGLANAGKSTLLNALVGSPLAAVSDKPHTTRRGILGAFTRGNAQVLLVDTPGLVVLDEARKRERELVRAPWEALDECGVALLVLDASAPDEWRLAELAERMQPHVKRVVALLNKIDAVREGGAMLRALDRVRALGLGSEPLLVSALRGTHVEDLRAELLHRAAPGDWEVAAERATEASPQWRVHEAVRQGVFERLHKEIPYAVRQRTTGWLDAPELLQVQHELLLPKASQARMAVGRGGEVVRAIAEQASARLSQALGKPVRLTIYARHCDVMPATEFD